MNLGLWLQSIITLAICLSDRNKMDDWRVHRQPSCSFSGASFGFFAAVQPLLKPAQYFLFNPSHSVDAQAYPLGEFPGFLQSCNVLRWIQNQLFQLALWQYPYHDLSRMKSIAMPKVTTIPRLGKYARFLLTRNHQGTYGRFEKGGLKGGPKFYRFNNRINFNNIYGLLVPQEGFEPPTPSLRIM